MQLFPGGEDGGSGAILGPGGDFAVAGFRNWPEINAMSPLDGGPTPANLYLISE
jgi:hypothetical protein